LKRRLELARGLMTKPAVLFLDEPTIGFDIQTRMRMWEFLWGVSIWTVAFWAYYRLFLFTFHPFMQASFTTVTIDYNFNFSHDYIILHIPVLPS